MDDFVGDGEGFGGKNVPVQNPVWERNSPRNEFARLRRAVGELGCSL
jgi:hypothetical protein